MVEIKLVFILLNNAVETIPSLPAEMIYIT